MSLEPNKDNVSPFDEPKSVQAQASAWLARLDSDQPSSQDLQAFKRWVNEDDAHIAAFKKVAAAWDELNILTRLPSLLEQKDLQRKEQQPAMPAFGFARFSLRQLAVGHPRDGLDVRFAASLPYAPASQLLDRRGRAKNHYPAR